MLTQHVYIEAQIEQLRILLHSSSLNPGMKDELLKRLNELRLERVETLCNAAQKPLTPTKLRYILTFLIDMEVCDVAKIFHVDAQSVYSVRYRLRKLFPQQTVLPF